VLLSFLKKLTTSAETDKHLQVKQQLSKIDELPLLEAFEQSTKLLISIGEDKGFSSQAYLDCLYQIEAMNAVKSLQLSAELFPNSGCERHLLTIAEAKVYPYYKRLFLELLLMAERMKTELEHGSLSQQAFAVHLCKTLNAGINVCKWRFFDDQPAPAVTWTNLHRLYLFAEKSSVLYESVPIYQHQKIKFDFASQYATVLMLHTMHQGNFTAQEIEMASQLLPLWLQGVVFEKNTSDQQYQYFVDLAGDCGAERLRTTQHKNDYRYWKTADMVKRVETYVLAMREKNLPSDSSIRSFGTIPMLYRMLKKMAQEWSVTQYKRQRRKASRTPVDKRVFATFGLAQICEYLAMHDEVHSSNLKKAVITQHQDKLEALQSIERTLQVKQSLHIVDESYHGFGVDLGVAPSGYIQPGHLIGCWHPSHQGQYVVAEVKSVRKQKNGHFRAGLQIISSHSVLVSLNKLERQTVALSDGFYLDDGELAAVADLPEFNCLLIPANDGPNNSKPSVIIPSCEYKTHRHFSFSSNGEEKTIEIGLPMAKQADWVRAAIVAIH
jgi:hypothetical protein